MGRDNGRSRSRRWSATISTATGSGGRPGKGNDKGKVEALVKYARQHFLTPVPQVASLAALNAALLERCRARQVETAGRHSQTITERLVADLAAMRELPAVPLEACGMRPGPGSSPAPGRLQGAGHSVPAPHRLPRGV